MIELRLCFAFELRNDPLRQHLAELHAPLVEGIDMPDRALGEDEVLVKRDQLAQRRRRQNVRAEWCSTADCLRRPGAEPASPACLPLSPARRSCRKRAPRLREDIGEQDVVMLGPADSAALQNAMKSQGISRVP